MAAKSVVTSPRADIGKDSTSENRKLHFMNVITLYLEMSGRNSPRYREKLRLLTSSRITPQGEVAAAPPECTELKIRKRMPTKLSATPPAFFPVMGSPRKKKAKNMVKMGPRVPMIAVSMADVMVMAMRKVICGTNSPTSEAAAIFQ